VCSAVHVEDRVVVMLLLCNLIYIIKNNRRYSVFH
jgi:hypothetical protein